MYQYLKGVFIAKISLIHTAKEAKNYSQHEEVFAA